MIFIKKAVRSIKSNKRSYMACIALVNIGVMFFVFMGSIVESLEVSRNTYYDNNNMSDVFATVVNIPESKADNLLKIDGIEDVSLQNVIDCKVVLDDSNRSVILRINSVNTQEYAPINKVNYREDSFYNDNDIIVADSFLEAQGLEIGDTLDIIINNKLETFNISGTGESPQYVFAGRNAKDVFPNPAIFNIAYVEDNALQKYLGKDGTYNTVYFTLKEGYDFDDVKDDLEETLKDYGLVTLYEKDDNMSAATLDARIDGLTTLSTTIPYAFIFMSSIVLYMMLKRVIEMDRGQIGTMKAFGYSNGKIVRHYMFYGLFTGLVGSTTGTIIGLTLYNIVFGFLVEFLFNLPFTLHP